MGAVLQSGRERGAVPLRLPSDSGIGPTDEPLPTSFTDAMAAADAIRGGAAGAELRAPAEFTRPFLDDSLIVLREQNGDVPGWLWAAAILVIAAFYVLFISGLALGVGRSARLAARTEPPLSDEAPQVPRPPRSTPGVPPVRAGRRARA